MSLEADEARQSAYEPEIKRPRKVDRSNADARTAVAETIRRFSSWRLDLARFATLVDRRFSEDERSLMINRCAAIHGELRVAREELILGLADAPPKVAGHSRVVDVERALDNIETTVTGLSKRLTQ